MANGQAKKSFKRKFHSLTTFYIEIKEQEKTSLEWNVNETHKGGLKETAESRTVHLEKEEIERREEMEKEKERNSLASKTANEFPFQGLQIILSSSTNYSIVCFLRFYLTYYYLEPDGKTDSQTDRQTTRQTGRQRCTRASNVSWRAEGSMTQEIVVYGRWQCSDLAPRSDRIQWSVGHLTNSKSF